MTEHRLVAVALLMVFRAWITDRVFRDVTGATSGHVGDELVFVK